MVTATDILKANILIVDDHEADVSLLKQILLGAGYTSIQSTMDPRKVCGLHHKQRFDLITLDLNMPHMNGFMVMECLKKVEKEDYLPLLVVSAHPDHMLRALQGGARDFVSKPFNLVEVLSRVRNIIEVRLLHQEAKAQACVLEHTLEEATERLHRTGNAAKVGLWERNLKTNETHYSLECKRQLGYEGGEISDTLEEWTGRIHPEDLETVQNITERYIAHQDFTFSHEFRLRHKDGSYRWILSQGSILYDDAGLPQQFLGSHINVSERKALEEQILQVHKMESVGRLAGGIAHDFNNLLNVIIGYTESAMEIVPEGDSLQQDLEQILRAGTRAAELTSQLLAFSRKQVFRLKVINLNAVLQDTEKMLQRLIREDVEVVYLPHATLGNIQADPGQIEQVLMNLVVNACDSMPDGGRLTLQTGREVITESHAQMHPLLPAGAYITLLISDTGCGMDAASLSQIFEPFFTTKEVGKGTGLGLATVYGIVHQSGGSIHVSSEVGAGTTFTVLLPEVEALVRGPAPPRLEARNQGSGIILLVEDDDALRNLTVRILGKAGYTVIAAASGPEALALLEKEPRLTRLLITDVVMPHMSGPELSERIKASGKRLKTLYVSGYADNAALRLPFGESNVNFLGKPFTAEALTQKVHELLHVV